MEQKPSAKIAFIED